MKPHKWAKEIKAWADGAEIESESQYLGGIWQTDMQPLWDDDEFIFRIKPQPKEPQYLYVYQGKNQAWLSIHNHDMDNYIGKIKLEVKNE